MCLAVPGRVLEISERDGTRIAQVDFGGVTKEVCLEYVPDLQVGEYTIVHVGFALQRLDEQSALETLELFRQMGELDAEFGDQWGRAAEQAGLPRPDLAPAWRQSTARPDRAERQAAMKYLDEFQDPALAEAAARRHPRHRHPALGDDGGLRRADPLDHPARARPAAARRASSSSTDPAARCA